jgi:hypothetical protein
MNNFFYDLNKRLSALADKQDAKQITESKQAEAVAKSPLTQALNEVGQRRGGHGEPEFVGIPGPAKGTKPSPKAITKGADREYYKSPGLMGEPERTRWRKKVEEPKVDEAGYSAKAGRAGKDLGKPGKNFSKIAKSAGEKYGSKAAGERVAGAVLNKLRHPANEGHCPACDCSPCECVEEGNAFTGALAKTPKGGKFKVGGKEFTDNSELEEGFADMDAWLASREKEKGTGKFDVKDTGYSKRYTRKHEDDEEKDDDKETKSTEPKRRGRPKSAKPKDQENVTKGSYKYKMVNGKRVLKDKVKEDGIPLTDRGEYDNEGSEVKGDMHTVIRHATELERHLRDQENLPTWVIEKIGQIKGMMTSVSDYILSQHERGVEHATGEEGVRIAEKITKNTPTSDVIHDFVHSKNPKFAGKSKKERINQALGASYAMKKGKMEEADKPDFLDLDKDGDKKESMKKAAKDKKAKEEKVEETTTAGSVATATTSGKSSKGSMQFGKGVYESLNASVEQMITESITVENNMDECGDMGQAPSITVQADGEEAAKLLMLLKLAGLSGQELDENKPDWPTDDQTLTTEPNLRTYSGGLNGPKSTGQTTVPVVASQLRRQASMEESVELERSLFKTWKNYKG